MADQRIGLEDVPVPVTSFAVALGRARTANGGWEWFLLLNGERVYASEAGVGVFADPDVCVEEAFARVLLQWARAARLDDEGGG